jgi:predicted nucleic acid-binding protein
MPAWLLDSVALIDWYCGRRGVEPYVRRMLGGEESGAFSTLSEVELWQGLRPDEEARHQALLSLLERLPVDGAVARRAGRLRQERGLATLSLPDAVIAATAQLSGRTLLTRNTRDFAPLRGQLSVEFYPGPGATR